MVFVRYFVVDVEPIEPSCSTIVVSSQDVLRTVYTVPTRTVLDIFKL